MTEQIIYKYKMDREPSLEDRTKKVGFNGFIKELQRHGWASDDSRVTALKNFRVEYEGHIEPGNNYIQWTGVLRV